MGPHFRAGVIVVVEDGRGRVMAFERVDAPGSWQLPQGGIDTGEQPFEAAWRELGEETGLDATSVRFVSEYPRWTVYELPQQFQRGVRLGQAHRWFRFQLINDETEPEPDGIEFSSWRWMTPEELVGVTAEFRRPGYAEVLLGG
ncbi:MAG: NUDIX domain-containing protein [Actinomycetota bacterium]|nr:NUDIX domain-containing protein [Actinomycetota bacterium]MDA3014173.1 NUDIX domain-containing protein [Actinomycetota bacterium]MDA3028524.1 NUDIX domain-containing protein [Actinomycetota bacterium]